MGKKDNFLSAMRKIFGSYTPPDWFKKITSTIESSEKFDKVKQIVKKVRLITPVPINIHISRSLIFNKDLSLIRKKININTTLAQDLKHIISKES